MKIQNLLESHLSRCDVLIWVVGASVGTLHCQGVAGWEAGAGVEVWGTRVRHEPTSLWEKIQSHPRHSWELLQWSTRMRPTSSAALNNTSHLHKVHRSQHKLKASYTKWSLPSERNPTSWRTEEDLPQNLFLMQPQINIHRLTWLPTLHPHTQHTLA